MTLPSLELYSPIIGEYHDAIPVAALRDFIDQCWPPTWNHGIMWTKILRGKVFWMDTGRASDAISVAGFGSRPARRHDGERQRRQCRQASMASHGDPFCGQKIAMSHSRILSCDRVPPERLAF